VIAAAEIVAAARGHAMRVVLDEIVAWLNEHGGKLTHADAKLAKQAVAPVQKSQSCALSLSKLRCPQAPIRADRARPARQPQQCSRPMPR
jgi:hypothetical protein